MTDIVATESVLAGAPRIDGTRIGVHHVAERVLDAGASPADVAADYDLDLADVHRALTYYYDNLDEMRTVRERRTETASGLCEITPPARAVRGSDTDDPSDGIAHVPDGWV